MNIISNLLGQILKFIYDFGIDYGWAIILFTIIVKIILLPLTIKQTKSMKAMQDIQPRIKEIQEKYKGKPEKQNQEIMKVYQEAKINPMSGCLPLLIQFPILIGLYNVLRNPVTYKVFDSIEKFKLADKPFLGIPSLSTNFAAHGMANIPISIWILAILAGLTTFITQKLTMPQDQQQPSMKYMTYFMSFLMFFWGVKLPAGLAIYWTVSNVFQVLQYYLIMNPLKNKLANSGEGVLDETEPRNKK